MYTENVMDYKFLDIKSGMYIPKNKYSEFKISPNIKIDDYIYRFYDALYKNIDNNNLALFYKNIENLNVKNRITISDFISSVINGSYVSGAYCVRDNTIYLARSLSFFNSDLTHELLHMSSGIYDFTNNIDYCGFSQIGSGNNKIGYALNEGYTELLNKRLFSLGTEDSYVYEMFICSLVEMILGKDKMENFYFNADLLGIVNELAKYSNRIKVDRFLIRSDYLLYNLHKLQVSSKKINKVNNAFNYINYFLIDSAISKEVYNINNDFVSASEAMDNFILFSDKISKIDKYNFFIDEENVLNNINLNIDRGIKILKKI